MFRISKLQHSIIQHFGCKSYFPLPTLRLATTALTFYYRDGGVIVAVHIISLSHNFAPILVNIVLQIGGLFWPPQVFRIISLLVFYDSTDLKPTPTDNIVKLH